jgi:hypothetical protein
MIQCFQGLAAETTTNPMGDRQNDPLRLDFDRQFKLEFHGSTVTSGRTSRLWRTRRRTGSNQHDRDRPARHSYRTEHAAPPDGLAASTSKTSRLETETLHTTDSLKHLMDLPGHWIDQTHQFRKLTKLILDMDTSVSETHGH